MLGYNYRMKACQPHWDLLRLAIDKHGLGHLVPTNGHDALAAITKQMNGQGKPADFDPLMAAWFAILDNLARAGGAGILMIDGCPICYANDAHTEHCEDPNCTFSYNQWIIKAAHDMAVNK